MAPNPNPFPSTAFPLLPPLQCLSGGLQILIPSLVDRFIRLWNNGLPNPNAFPPTAPTADEWLDLWAFTGALSYYCSSHRKSVHCVDIHQEQFISSERNPLLLTVDFLLLRPHHPHRFIPHLTFPPHGNLPARAPLVAFPVEAPHIGPPPTHLAHRISYPPSCISSLMPITSVTLVSGVYQASALAPHGPSPSLGAQSPSVWQVATRRP